MLKKILLNISKVLIAAASALMLFCAVIYIAVVFFFTDINANIYLLLMVIIAVIIETAIIGALCGFIKLKRWYIPLCSVLGVCIAVFISIIAYQNHVDSIGTVTESDKLLLSYAPYADNSEAVTLNEQSQLTLTTDLPVMDGATALYPIYSAFAKAVYPKQTLDTTNAYTSEIVKCSTTTQAYQNIVTGDADIIFAALPSDEQQQFAKDNGVELVFTPIGKEGFVFFVNGKNPLDNISLEDIQNIYSGEVTNWSELGVDHLGKIKAFQRDEGSGSQSTLKKLMSGKNLMAAPQQDVVDGMGGIITKTADYKNYKNAIGYSFRFYTTKMVKNNQIKLVSVNGVYPSLENIENGKYPLASNFYAVTRKDADQNTLKLLNWITGQQGQKIIEMTGYTPLSK